MYAQDPEDREADNERLRLLKERERKNTRSQPSARPKVETTSKVFVDTLPNPYGDMYRAIDTISAGLDQIGLDDDFIGGLEFHIKRWQRKIDEIKWSKTNAGHGNEDAG